MTDAGDTAERQQAERLAIIGELAAGIAHEINNPVAYVRSNLDSLDDYLRDLLALMRLYEQSEPEIAERGGSDISERLRAARERVGYQAIAEDLPSLLEDCREGMGLVANIVSALRDFARDASEDGVPSDINELIRRALVLATNAVKHRAEVTTQLQSLPPVTCHPGRITQVILNLLVNAGQAMSTPGQIRVRTSHEGNEVVIEIADTGDGIPDALREQIFRPFFTTKREQHGTGMGLAIAQEIINGSGGSIELADLSGFSTCFRITLPAGVNG